MTQVARQVLKAAEVSLNSPVRMSLDPAVPADGGVSSSSPTTSGVRIVQNHPEYVVIEVTCPCGTTTQIRCDYVQKQ